ncbi:RND family efflux transporter MFP subunit [Azospirillum fermentarium]|uniref:efflux RND transporter periplasmic adaptor subunit n=1 Tax=Azospirillum fermentarium TaxID=1233114 RepID=UPI0022263A09|nr:efflux RND transporter periplasmic adaptor subunit [Azospirillum fermentarium]MCW2248857.1 RND family efflux transporter MFP subunit [Azospirillum fermentarium]
MTDRFILPLALLLSLTAVSAPSAADAPPPTRWTVISRPVEDLKAVFATVESVRQVKARTRIAGTLDGLTVREGDRVAEGQVIATVRDPKLALQRAALDARLTSLQAQMRQAQMDLDRASQLRATGSGSQQRLDDARTALDVLKAQSAAMAADRAVVEQQTREGDVLAPAAGRVLAVPAVDGAVMMAGEAVATLATDRTVLRLRLPERHARFIHVGDPVLVGDRGLSPEPHSLTRGTVTLVYPELVDGQVVADAVVAGLDGTFVGERVRVLVATGQRTATVVPAAFVTRQLGADTVRLADGRTVVVRVGRAVPAVDETTGGVEILSGLHPGDELVLPEGTR